MIEYIYSNEPTIRLSIFLGAFCLLLCWEWIQPKRKPAANKIKRWINNFSLIVCSTILVRFLVPTAAVGIAYLVEQNHWGFANHFELQFWLKCILTFVLLDFLIYFQHLTFHVLPILWRFHRVHHSDNDCDVTTGLRFHPVEILLSIGIKFTAIIILGAPVLAVILFEITLNFMSMFTHSNIRLNPSFEKILRWFIVTPDMHRIHHSTLENETNSNFSFHISLWDRLLGTYMDKPKYGQLDMKIGLDRFNEEKWQKFTGLLYMPLESSMRGYVINYRDTRNADELAKINKKLNTEIQENEKHLLELSIAKDKAEKANKAKSEFISNISHELRTPMHGILSFAALGIKRIKNGDQEKIPLYFDNIQTSGTRLLSLIDNLLNLTKLESGTTEINTEYTNLENVLQSCINEQQARIEELNLKVKVENAAVHSKTLFDPGLISQAITNLLSNAIKFSPKNATINILIFNKLNNSGNDNIKELLCFSILDEGVGIPGNELTDIFNSFKQSSRTKSGAGGTGLGLAITKNILSQHQGKIWAENKQNGHGACFTFSLPIYQKPITS